MKIDSTDSYRPTRRNKGQAVQSTEPQNQIDVDARTKSGVRLEIGNPTVAATLVTGNPERSKTIFHRSRQIDRMLDWERAQNLPRQ
jgi:hypothetical protein